MKSFYSILNVPVRPAAQEHLNIGLLLVGEQEVYFKISNHKLNFVKKLIPENAFTLLKSYVFGLSEEINASNNIIRTKFRNDDFVSYLSNYNSNLLTFSRPIAIDLEGNEKNFRTLFEKFIFTFEQDASEIEVHQSLTVQSQLKQNLYPRIRQRVNLNQVLTTKEIPTLLVPSIKINFIGQNKLPVAGQGVDFEKSTDQITNSISRLISLIKAFDMEKQKGRYYIVGKEPNKKLFRDQHNNWQHIRDSSLIEFVDLNDLEKISDYIETHDVKPFVEGQ